MNPWFAKAAILAGTIIMIAIRAPHGQRSRGVKVASRHRGRIEAAVLILATASFVVPLLWLATPIFGFAEFALRPIPFAAGVICLALGLVLFHRSHADLGTNWSVTLELRENHRLITHGVYRRIRHPMYTALLVYSIGQALALPNWIAGPSYLVALFILVMTRLAAEERMMRERFGADYDAYAAHTHRLIPGVW